MARGKWQRADGKWFSERFEICRLPFEIPFSVGSADFRLSESLRLLATKNRKFEKRELRATAG
jgi:hypothetical protein